MSGGGRQLLALGASTDPAVVGGKAAYLARAQALGHAVPPGVVLPATAGPIDHAAIAEIVDGLVARLGGSVAVRSSSPIEDLPSASAAGQFLTVLGVTDDAALADAVDECLRHAADGPADPYRRRGGADLGHEEATTACAVLVQAMLEPDAAGIAFTRDPVTGADQVTIEAVPGLGHGLAEGSADGERWVVPDDDASPDPGAHLQAALEHPVLDSHRAAQVADLARRLETELGFPVDVEWVLTDGRCHVLQVRPMTVVPARPAVDVPRGQTFVREPRYAEPLTPLSFSAWLPRHSAILADVFERLGLPVDTIDNRHLYGRVYSRAVVLGDPGRDGMTVPDVLVRTMFRLVPLFRRRLDRSLAWDDAAATLAVVRQWTDHDRQRTRDQRRRLRTRELDYLENRQLADHLDQVLAHIDEVGTAHFLLSMLGRFLWVGRLGLLCEDLLGWDARQVTTLLGGFGQAATEHGRAILALRNQLDEKLLSAALEDADVLRGHAAVEEYLDRHGHRLIGELRHPTEAEDLRLVADHLRRTLPRDDEPLGVTARRRAAQAEKRARAGIASSEDLERFDATLAVARTTCQFGDDSEPDTYDAITLVRPVALEAGRRLDANGRIRRADDVWFLDVGELSEALRGGGAAAADVERRRNEHAWALANPAPDIVGPAPVPPPSARAVPARWRSTVGAIFWALALEGTTTTEQSNDSGRLQGISASVGQVVGTVRVVRTPADFVTVQAGDVIVCPIAVASWSSVLAAAGAIVTEHGGLLSHTATLAREYGIPAVLGVPHASQLLRDGHRVRVDGRAATVEML